MCVSSQQCLAPHRDAILGALIFVIAMQTLTIGKIFEIAYLGGVFIDLISQISKISKNKALT